jgi:hypothetical protein
MDTCQFKNKNKNIKTKQVIESKSSVNLFQCIFDNKFFDSELHDNVDIEMFKFIVYIQFLKALSSISFT